MFQQAPLNKPKLAQLLHHLFSFLFTVYTSFTLEASVSQLNVRVNVELLITENYKFN